MHKKVNKDLLWSSSPVKSLNLTLETIVLVIRFVVYVKEIFIIRSVVSSDLKLSRELKNRLQKFRLNKIAIFITSIILTVTQEK